MQNDKLYVHDVRENGTIFQMSRPNKIRSNFECQRDKRLSRIRSHLQSENKHENIYKIKLTRLYSQSESSGNAANDYDKNWKNFVWWGEKFFFLQFLHDVVVICMDIHNFINLLL